MRKLLFVLVALAIVPPVLDLANGFLKPTSGCRVLTVVDGDTVKLLCPDTGYGSARLLGFDAPEISDPACLSEAMRGLGATFHLRWQLWQAGAISSTRHGQDRYGRDLIRMTLDGIDIAETMIAAGQARRYSGGVRAGWCGQS